MMMMTKAEHRRKDAELLLSMASTESKNAIIDALVESGSVTRTEDKPTKPSILEQEWVYDKAREGVYDKTGTLVMLRESPDEFLEEIAACPDAFRALSMVRHNKNDDNGSHPITRQTMGDVEAALKKAGVE